MNSKVLLEKDDDDWYVATVPVLPGCISQGKTKEEALENINQAIEFHISMLAGDGTGLSRDIVDAAATGVIASRGKLKKVG
jgi:predicted RNase H-like HicB family nuclease